MNILCYLFWLLLGFLLGWVLSRMFAPRPVQTIEKLVDRPVEKIVEKIVEKQVDNPAHLAKISSLEASLAAASLVGAGAVAVKASAPKAAAKPAVKVAAKAAAKPAAKKPAPAKTYVLNKELAKASGYSPKGIDDLIVIEGIGPKIKELFHADGIKMFHELAATPVKKMQAILDAAGPRYKLANPATWAKQAGLAANNKWAALRILQDELSGGVKK